jgi:4'-phosphopantetheinyl transferase
MLTWNLPSNDLALTAGDLHVWQVSLDQPTDRVERFRASLSADEQARADRFHFDRDRRRYIVARGVLRSILGRYLDVSPDCITFDYSAKGKPGLPPVAGQIPLHFNLAHSHEMAVYAFTQSAAVGVDVEYSLRPVMDIDQLAARFFSANENAIYRSLADSQRRPAFFRCWTRKEAYIKAIGAGLSQPLDRFDVTLAPDQPAALVSIDGDPVAAGSWSLFHFEPAPQYVGAVAVKGHAWQVIGWVYRP